MSVLGISNNNNQNDLSIISDILDEAYQKQSYFLWLDIDSIKAGLVSGEEHPNTKFVMNDSLLARISALRALAVPKVIINQLEEAGAYFNVHEGKSERAIQDIISILRGNMNSYESNLEILTKKYFEAFKNEHIKNFLSSGIKSEDPISLLEIAQLIRDEDLISLLVEKGACGFKDEVFISKNEFLLEGEFLERQ